IAFGHSTFVVVGDTEGGNHPLQTSTDGYQWTDRSMNYPALRGAGFGNGTFVALAGYSGEILTSTDGVNWTARKMGPPEARRLSYGNGAFVAVGTQGDIFQSGTLSSSQPHLAVRAPPNDE